MHVGRSKWEFSAPTPPSGKFFCVPRFYVKVCVIVLRHKPHVAFCHRNFLWFKPLGLKFWADVELSALSQYFWLSDPECTPTQIEKVAGNDATRIWRIIKSAALVENMPPEADITKKLAFARMAEAEANGNPLTYDTIEPIIENDTASAGSKASEQPMDIAMGLWSGGKNKGGRGG